MTGEITITWGATARSYRIGQRMTIDGFTDGRPLYVRVLEIHEFENRLVLDTNPTPPTRWQRFLDWWSTDLLHCRL